MTTNPRPLSISALRKALQCSLAYKLAYVDGSPRYMSAAAWFGSVMHETIRLAYAGLPIADATVAVWRQECGPVFADLEHLAEHVRDRAVFDQVRAFQETHLGHYAWGKHSLPAFYRRALALAACGDQLIVERPLLVEGLPPEQLTRVPQPVTHRSDEEANPAYALLHGILGGVAVYGVPDVVWEAEGTFFIADYKTGREVEPALLAEDAQLALYAELLRQNGVITPGKPVKVGHIYLGNDDVHQVWANTDTHNRLLETLSWQVSHVQALIDSGFFIPVYGVNTAFNYPCPYCDMRRVCPVTHR